MGCQVKKGGEFENFISSWIGRVGNGTIKRAEPPIRVIHMDPTGGTFRGVYLSAGVLDFVGSWRGAHVEFDAKDISGDRFQFTNPRAIRPGQAQRALALIKDDVLAVGLLLRFRGANAAQDRIWWLPWRTLLKVQVSGKKSLTTAMMPELDGTAQISYAWPSRDMENMLKALFSA